MVSSGTVGCRGTDVPGGRVALTLLLAASLTACVRAPLDDVCPRLAPGDIVVSELRGPQSGSYRQWIEVYNASDTPVPASGLRLEFTRLDGNNFFDLVVRDDSLIIEPGEYLVIGGGSPDQFPYIDFDFTPDHHSSTPGKDKDPASLYQAGTLELSACDVALDQVLYQLPAEGTLSLDGSAPPDAATNDDSNEGWCANNSPSEGPQTGIGLNGTPGEANPPCP